MSEKCVWPTFSSSDSGMDMLVKISQFFGKDERFVIGGGGNTSVKTADRLWVKASGTSLATIGPDGFVELDRAILAACLEGPAETDPLRREEAFKQAIMSARLDPSKGLRPSVESVLHNMLPSRFVVHSHSTFVNMITCCAKGEEVFRKLFGGDLLWVPYVDPGITLARTLLAAIRDFTKRTGQPYPPVIMVQNHGLIVCGDTPEEIRERTDSALGKIAALLPCGKGVSRGEGVSPLRPEGILPSAASSSVASSASPVRKEETAEETRGRDAHGTQGQDALATWEGAYGTSQAPIVPERGRKLINIVGPALRGLLAEGEALKVVTFDDSAPVVGMVCGSSGKAAATGGPLTPDQIVYCNSFPLWIDLGDEDKAEALVPMLRKALADHQAATGYAAKMVLVKGLGLFSIGDDYLGARTAASVYVDIVMVMAGASLLGGVHPLPDRERRFIESWEVEAYRKNIAAGKAKAGKAAGKVVVVTGAAQGFGLEIAKDFAAQAAHVVLCDVNLAGARAAADALAAQAGRGRALAVEINVTTPASVQAALHQVVRAYGGFDVLVSNAGVLKAESVKTQSERDFDFVTSVNYKGYFVCVQAAAPVLAVQRMAKDGYTSDIIQINSKSGLAGSNRNFAYAGSKFGGVGLTQSFAMELIADGVKVNAICPGNFFDGPLWSDPNTGLFVQYLRTGKVPGAKTIADVRHAYEAKVPMGRGCEAADVMKAIYYVIEQKYETGQAVPVTGGQVMLS